MLFKFIKSSDDDDIQLQDKTLLLSIPSVGNVGQLAADFLITNIPNTKKIGYIDTPHVLPVVGNDAFKHNGGNVNIGAEVYEMTDYSTILLHIRSPIQNMKTFSKSFVQWVVKEKFSKMCILASANASYRMDNLLSDIQQHSITVRCKVTRGNDDGWNESSVVRVVPPLGSLAIANTHRDRSDQTSTVGSEEDLFLKGLSKYLIDECELNHVSCCLLLIICNEGDNIPHGTFLAEIVALHVLFEGNVDRVRQIQWVLPNSWKQLYGSPASSSLY